jgi:tetratricopeptide (TPR) repeat protein
MRDAEQCGRCGATFLGLCACGAEHSLFADACGACGGRHVPRRLPLSRNPWMRAGRWTALAAAVAGAAWFALAPRPVPADELRAAAEDACTASRFEAAVAICERLVAEHPGDAEGWLLLARSRRGAGAPADSYVADAERAVAASPRNAAAHTFLARAEAARGRLPAAIAHAAAATSLAPDDADSWLLVADLEMRKPRPDLARVRDALEHAQARGLESRDAQLLLADVSIRLNGAEGTVADRLSTGAVAALRRALAALDANRAAENDPLAAGRSRARFLLALGQADDAFAAAEAALQRVPPDTSPAATADVRLLRAMALHSRGNRAEALLAFAEVLRDRPDAATAGAASAFLLASDDRAAARDLLTRAADADRTGGIRAVLASALLEAHDLDGAAQAITAACAASPADPFFAELRGSIREAEGRLADARDAYAEAARLSDAFVGPRVRLALLVLAEIPEEDAKPGAYDAAIADLASLRVQFDDDALLLEGLGRLQLARGDVTAARAALEAAAARRPSDADVWLALAEARRRSGDATRLDDTADALARARRLRPTDSAIAAREVRAWIDAGKPDVAAAACGEHLRRRSHDAAVLRLRADAYGRLGMWSLAAEDLRRVSQLPSATSEDLDLAHLVVALVRAGDAVGANRAVEDAGAAPGGVPRLLGQVAALLSPDAGEQAKALAGAGPSPLLAWLQFEAGLPGEALATLRALMAGHPGDPLATRLFVTVALATETPRPEDVAEARAAVAALPVLVPAGLPDLLEGRLLAALGRPRDAAARLRDAERSFDGGSFASFFLAEALLASGERTEGLAALRRAVATPGADPWVTAVAAKRLLSASLDCKDATVAEMFAREARGLDPSLVGAARRAASLLHARGDFARAADVSEAALAAPSLAPDDALRLRVAAVTDRRLDGEFGAALEHVAVLPPAARDSVPAKLLRGLAELDAGRLDDAGRLLAAAFDAAPDDAAAVSGLVVTALRRGDADGALARLGAWSSAHPDDRDVTLSAGLELLRLGRTDAAVTLAVTCAALHPRDFAVARLHARAIERTGDAAGSARALRAFAANASPLDALDACLAAGAFAGRHGIDADGALVEARRVAEDSAATPYVRALARVTEAEILLATGRPRDAENAALCAVAAVGRAPARGRPERRIEARARRVLGLVAASATPPRRADAIAELTRGAQLDPANTEASLDLARLLAVTSETAPRALEISSRLTATEPCDPSVWETHAEACRAAGRLEDARTAWTRALELLPASRTQDAEHRGRVALRFARFLRDCDDAAAARRVADEARRAAAGTPVEPELVRFLAE